MHRKFVRKISETIYAARHSRKSIVTISAFVKVCCLHSNFGHFYEDDRKACNAFFYVHLVIHGAKHSDM